MSDNKPRAAFTFVEGRPDDLVVVIKPQSEANPVPRRINVYYTDSLMPGVKEFDADRAYNQDGSLMASAAMRFLLQEIRARLRQGVEFKVWYFDAASRGAVEAAAAGLSVAEPALRRAFEALVLSNKLISEAEQV